MNAQPPEPPSAPPPLPGDRHPAPAAETVEPEPVASACPGCGAQLRYAPGTMVLRCETCGTEEEIEPDEATITEHSFDEWRAANPRTFVADVAEHEMQCGGCGATSVTTELATTCQFCGGALVAVELPEGLVEPEAVVPFHVDRTAAKAAFRDWISSRRFAPNALRDVGTTEALTGTYLPHWTFDARTTTDYRGRRGDYYYTTHTRTVSDGKGGTRTETYQKRHTRWRDKNGRVRRDFDDVLVLASHALDQDKVDKMGPWSLHEAQPFQHEFLVGYSAIRYDVDPQHGSENARREMSEVIERDVERDIGGDEQRIKQMHVAYDDATFKLMLMPLWIATYLYGGQTWQVMVNAKTGEVVGDRPYSKVKIALAVLAALLLVAAVVGVILVGQDR